MKPRWCTSNHLLPLMWWFQVNSKNKTTFRSHFRTSAINEVELIKLKWRSAVSVGLSWHLDFIWLLKPESTKSLQGMYKITLSGKKVQQVEKMRHDSDITKNRKVGGKPISMAAKRLQQYWKQAAGISGKYLCMWQHPLLFFTCLCLR